MAQYVEKRRPKFRRKGETDGCIDWDGVKQWALNKGCLILVCAIMFMAGRIWEVMQPTDNNHAWWKDYAASRIRTH